MIRPRYALQLARTKLRSKRGVLVASIIVSSILFAVLIAAIVIFTGVQKSALSFVKAANNNQYLVAVQPNIPNSVTGFYGNDSSATLSLDTVRAITAYQKQYYDAQKATYKAAGVTYDASSEVAALKPADYMDSSLPEEQRVMINWSSPVISAMLADKFAAYAKTAQNKVSDIQRLGAQYGATNYYNDSYRSLAALPATYLVQNKKEDFGAQQAYDAQVSTADEHAIHNSSYVFSDTALVTRNLLIADASNLKGIPVIPSAQEVASLFGKQLGVSTEPQAESQKATWLQSVQDKAKGFVYQACYRNSAEQALLQKIQSDDAEIKANQDNKDYQKPSLLYDYPKTACGDITVQSDTRATAEKQAAAQLESDQKKLGTYVVPAHQLLTFEIVGLANAQAFIFSPTNVTDYVKGLLSANNFQSAATSAAVIPKQLYDALPSALQAGDMTDKTAAGALSAVYSSDDFKSRVVAFSTVDQARRFINDVGCPSSASSCSKLFYADPYGSNYLLLDEMGAWFARVMSIAFPVLLGLALLIIWFTISRIMAENRKETAVYRAMGARRIDITAIYTAYVLLVALRIALVSLALGVVAAFVVNYLYAPGLRSTATAMFGSIKNAPQLSLFDVTSPLLWLTIVSIFIVSLVASIQPLIRNVLRAPVRDMREE